MHVFFTLGTRSQFINQKKKKKLIIKPPKVLRLGTYNDLKFMK